MKVHHIVYKTVNLVNNKFYIGVHKSTKLTDEYLGSGKWIKRSIIKYGKENFRRENLFIFLDSASAYGKEAELVSLHLKDPLCMNLKQGGMGGFHFINDKGLNGTLLGVKAGGPKIASDARYLKEKLDPEFYKKQQENRLKNIKIAQSKTDYKELSRLGNLAVKERGSCQSEEFKRKMSDASSGINNSQYGTCWITNGEENKKIKKEDIHLWLNQGWNKGRQLKIESR